MVCRQRAVLPIQSVIAALQIIHNGHLAHFFEFELDGSGGVGAAEDYNDCLACFKFYRKSAPNGHYYLQAGCHNRPGHSAE